MVVVSCYWRDADHKLAANLDGSMLMYCLTSVVDKIMAQSAQWDVLLKEQIA